MHRILIVLSILPILAVLMYRKFFADRALTDSSQKELKHDAQQLARKMLDSMHHENINVKSRNISWAGMNTLSKNVLTLPPDISNGLSAREHGKAALEVGLFLLLCRNPKVIARRQWAIRFGQVFPIFTTIVAIFALLVAKVSPSWLLSIITTSLATACCAQILTIMANLQAADLATIVLERKRIFPRLNDEEAVIKATKAWARFGIVPGLLSRLM